ncbi:MAG: winged helix-turn-helix transcriptional regulator [Candidatus Methanomethylophilaceae archaeon]|nr:winged helix-turn-helix transcriptional regulator [Candidatus Methanomethylophilaceae archaeon]
MSEEIETRLILHAVRSYVGRQVRPVLDEEGLKPSYGPMLRVVKLHPGCSLKDISDKTYLDKAMVTRTASALIEEGFVENRSEESRFYSLYITEKGTDALDAVKDATDRAWSTLTGTLTEEEKECWNRVMRKFWTVIRSEGGTRR